MDQNATIIASTLRGPNLSAMYPEGVWNSAYPKANIERTHPICLSDRCRLSAMGDFAADMHTRSIYNMSERIKVLTIKKYLFGMLTYFSRSLKMDLHLLHI